MPVLSLLAAIVYFPSLNTYIFRIITHTHTLSLSLSPTRSSSQSSTPLIVLILLCLSTVPNNSTNTSFSTNPFSVLEEFLTVLISTQFYWPKMRPNIHSYMTKCQQCQVNKAERLKAAGLLHGHSQ